MRTVINSEVSMHQHADRALTALRRRSACAARLDYFESEARRACFWASCLECFAARFSLSDLPGFFALPDGIDLDAMAQAYDVTRDHRVRAIVTVRS
jgi:hypothetical protein